MGKASTRRKKRRQEYLGHLARENPKKFQSEWAKRLESWSEEASHRAHRLMDKDGNPAPAAFTLVDDAMNELAACGEKAVELEFESTRETMIDSCCRAVAKTVDYRMYRLSNTRSNQCRMEAGIHKPPR